MAMSKIERIEKEIQKTREKITEYQNKLRGLEAQKTEAENLANRAACTRYASDPAGAYRYAFRQRYSGHCPYARRL